MTVRNSELAGQKKRDVILPGDSLILSIKRDNEILIPHGSTRLELDDQVSILVDNTFTYKIMDLFQRHIERWSKNGRNASTNGNAKHKLKNKNFSHSTNLYIHLKY